MSSPVRINKYLSQCGVTSRRGAEGLIAKGLVTVNDELVTKLGTIINTETDTVKVNGTKIKPVTKKFYVLFNKPTKVITTLHDPFGRKTVAYFTRSVPARVYPVGRLDFDTQGALLLTNDGDLAYRLAHPKYQVEKVYHAWIKGHFSTDMADKIASGIKLSDGHIGRGKAEFLHSKNGQTRIQMTLKEGHKHEVKQLLKAVGTPVKKLVRVEFAGLRVQGLKPGRWRFLNHKEIRKLKDLVDL